MYYSCGFALISFIVPIRQQEVIDNVIKCISFGSKSVTWTPLNRIAAIPSPTKEFMLKFSNFRESLAKPTKSVPVRYIRELLLKFCGLIPFSRVDFSLIYFKPPTSSSLRMPDRCMRFARTLNLQSKGNSNLRTFSRYRWRLYEFTSNSKYLVGPLGSNRTRTQYKASITWGSAIFELSTKC